MYNRFNMRNPWLHLVLLLAVYAVLLLPTLGRQGISWDEQNDLWIAQAYLRPGGWLTGSDIDPSQARLPMFAAALVYVATGRSDLITARGVSALVGGLALVGVFCFTRRRFSAAHGLLACALLATSPFYLSFARVAFTETDIFLAGAVAWLLVALDRLYEKPTLGRAAPVGLLLGLAISTKFTALALLPGIWAATGGSQRAAEENRIPPAHAWAWAAWCAAATLAAWDFARRFPDDSYTLTVQSVHYALALVSWLLPLAWAVRFRRHYTGAAALAGFVTGLGLLTFFILPPEHLTNPEILGSLFWRAKNELAFHPSFMVEAAALHLFSILFKSTPILGLGLLAGWAAALRRWREPALRPAVLLSAGYFSGLLILPIAQTFYTIPLLPLLAVFAADLFLRVWAQRRRWALALGIAALVGWSLDVSQCYPDYNLNGYQWLGKRALFGRSTIGYRSVVQTPSDGVQQAIEYVNTHALPGQTVQVYALEWHIVAATAGNPAYRLRNGFESTLNSNPDFVVVHINTLIRQSWYTDVSRGDLFWFPYDPVKLGQEYKRVFTVRRAFGLEAASVWRREEGP